MRWNKSRSFWVVCLILFFSGCQLSAKENSPYIISGEMLIEESKDYEIAGLDLYVYNKLEKNISSFTVVFFLFDSEGNAPEGGKNVVVLTVTTEIEGKNSLKACINLDKYMREIPEEPYQIDYIYLSKIVYDDGTEWNDPLGFQLY